MAGTKETVYTTIVTESMKGYQNITFTNWTNTAEPAINQGGRVEIKGALFSFAGNEDLDASNNWPGFGNSTQIYGYYLVGGGGTTVVCELTTTAPTWQEESEAWYDTATDTNRFWGGIYKDGSGNYADKFLYVDRTSKTTPNNFIDNRGNLDLSGYTNDDKQIDFASDARQLWDESENEFYFNRSLKVAGGIETDGTKFKTKKIDIGDWNMNSTSSVSKAHGVTLTKIRSVTSLIQSDSGLILDPDGKYDNTITGIGYYVYINNTNVFVTRRTGSVYDVSPNYNAVSPEISTRGWIIITYEA